jgi:hypothetical protein
MQSVSMNVIHQRTRNCEAENMDVFGAGASSRRVLGARSRSDRTSVYRMGLGVLCEADLIVRRETSVFIRT